jgi:hypothetical protein
MLRLVVPSFNRACQLECLLRSLHEQCPNLDDFSMVVFFRHTTEDFQKGYQLVRQQFPKVEFVEQSLERSFKEQFMELTDQSDFFGMIVDDMIVLEGFHPTDRPFELLKNRSDIFSLSLRLDGSRTFSQPINEGAKPPKHDADLIWRWKPKLSRKSRINRFVEKAIYRSAFYDWAFPCPMDGTVYRTDFFRQFLSSIEDFKNIPFMERSLSQAVLRFRDSPPNMIRYPRARSISLAMNSVDEYHDYPSLGLDPEQFNRAFLDGRRLDYKPFQKIVFHACHVACEPFWLSA